MTTLAPGWAGVIGALSATLVVLVIAPCIMCWWRRHEERTIARDRLRWDDELQRLAEAQPLADPTAFHLFLSHSWHSGQDQMRVVKDRLVCMVPDLRVFLE